MMLMVCFHMYVSQTKACTIKLHSQNSDVSTVQENIEIHLTVAATQK